MEVATRQRVLELFEQHRDSPGLLYDEKHFLDFLLTNPKSIGAVRNSFAGLRRFNRFIADAQYEFRVCLSADDRETTFSVDRFVKRVNELQRSPRSSLMSLKNQEEAGPGWSLIVWSNLVLFGLMVGFRSDLWLVALLVLLLVALNIAFVVFARNTAAYLGRLRARIEGKETSDDAV